MYNDAIQEKLIAGITENNRIPLFLPAKKVESLLKDLNLTIHQLLLRLVPLARSRAICPISNFHVGVTGLAGSGNVYLGTNVEFIGFPLNFSIHAEQCLISHIAFHDETDIKAIGLSAAPCGHCRQFMTELKNFENIEICVEGQPLRLLKELLPSCFSPIDLGNKSLMLHHHDFKFSVAHPSLNNMHGSPSLYENTLKAVKKAWAPYSECYSAVGIEVDDGRTFTGIYLECAAYNPSQSPLQTALATLVAHEITWDKIRHVILIEVAGKISHNIFSKYLLQSISPIATYTYIPASLQKS